MIDETLDTISRGIVQVVTTLKRECTFVRCHQSGREPVTTVDRCSADRSTTPLSTPIMSTTLGPAELRSILAFTVNLARTAGTLILEGSQAIQASSDVNEKKNSVDLVTQYDVAVENLVMGEIKKSYPVFKLYVTFA